MDLDFDWNNISLDQQAAIQTVIKQLQVMGKMDETTQSNLLKKFKIESPEMKPCSESKFWNLARSFGIFCKEEGFKIKPDGNQVPLIRLNADIDTLDEFLEYCRGVLNNWEEEQKTIMAEPWHEPTDDLEYRKIMGELDV